MAMELNGLNGMEVIGGWVWSSGQGEGVCVVGGGGGGIVVVSIVIVVVGIKKGC